MSQTPDSKQPGTDQTKDYLDSWNQITRWTEEGRSWSGNEKNCCFLNLDGKSFADVSAVSGFNFPDDARGIAVVDWDHDGRLDFWVSARSAPQIRLMQNQGDPSGRFLTLRLVAREGNLDAIGARVEVVVDDTSNGSLKNVRVLRAGEGFLSQSSKWLHFGLGAAKSMATVRVHWPSGEVETWQNLELDRHYVLTQSQAEASPWRRPRDAKLKAGNPTLPKTTDEYSHLLAARLPLPPLHYLDRENKNRSTKESKSSCQLVLLWASWCKPCLVELKALAESKSEFTESEIEVLALSVDGLANDSTQFKDALEAANRLSIPFTIGHATPELLERLQSVNDELFSAKRPLPLPSSFLISEGRLIAIYRGPAHAEVVLEDLKTRELSGQALINASLAKHGLEGRWQFAPAVDHLKPYLDRARQLLAAKQFEPASKLLMNTIDMAPDSQQARLMVADVFFQQGKVAQAREQYAAAIELHPSADAYSKLGVIHAMTGDKSAAIVHFSEAVKLEPQNAMHLGNLGKALLDNGQRAAAKDALEKSVALSDSNVAAMLNLSTILSTSSQDSLRDGGRAVALAERSIALSKNPSPVLFDCLAKALAEQGEFTRAGQANQQALQLAQKQGRKALMDQLMRRALLYAQEKPFRSQD